MITNVILTNENGTSKSAYDDFGLIMVSKVLEAPEPKIHKIDVQGRDGNIDLTNYLAGEVKFTERNLSLKFRYLGPEQNRTAINSELLNFCHGQDITFNFTDDLEYIYKGRMITNVPTVNKNKAFDFEISAIVEPFKRDLQSSGEEWLWDPFDFETGIINELDSLDLPANQYVGYVLVGTIEDYPVITAHDTEVEVWYDVSPEVAPQVSSMWTIPANATQKLYECKILKGEHWFTFRARNTAGSVTVDYRGGML